VAKNGIYAALFAGCNREAIGRKWWARAPTPAARTTRTHWDGTAKVHAILENALKTEQAEIIRQLVATMSKHKIDSRGGSRFVAKAAATDPKFHGDVDHSCRATIRA